MSTDADNAQDARSVGTADPAPPDSTIDEGTTHEAPGRPLDPPDPPDTTREPWYDVASLARRLGCTPAILHNWFRQPGGPRHRTTKGVKNTKIIAKESVVRAWAEKNGKRAVKLKPGEAPEPPRVESAPAAPCDSVAPEPAPDAGPLFAGAEPEQAHDSMRARLATLHREISLLLKSKPDGTSASQTKAWADAVSQLSKEVRLIEEHLHEEDERDGRVIDRRTALRLFSDLAREFCTAVETIAPDVVRAVYDAVRTHQEVAQTPEGFTRLGIAACQATVESLRERVAEAITRIATSIDPAAQVTPTPTPTPITRSSEAAA